MIGDEEEERGQANGCLRRNRVLTLEIEKKSFNGCNASSRQESTDKVLI